MREVSGRVAFITGGASGIGLGIARACVRAGMKVVIADINQDRLTSAMTEFARIDAGSSVHGIALDVTDRAAFKCAADEAELRFGAVQVLVNNAGVALLGGVKELKYADWDWGLQVMLGGVVNGIQTFLPRLLRQGKGHICSTSSMSALLPVNGAAIYCAAKAALIALTEVMRGELAPDNIGVSVVCPGPVQTNIRETGRLRPARYMDSNLLARERRLAARRISLAWMTSDECGKRVLAGIQRNDLYIFTHREFKESLANKSDLMLAAFPDEEIDRIRALEIDALLHNPVFEPSQRRQT
jgi:NAD(P)-dependent dehydrogenase (short-subunit alcohol dehydrogenase family)